MNALCWWKRTHGLGFALLVAGVVAASGCTRESLRVAIETQQRADQVQQAVFEQQHEALCVLLYHDLLNRLEQAGAELDEEQRAAVNEAWNQRDLLEFWQVQQERARALRLVGVDAKLAGDQSTVDLLIKAVQTRVDRVEEHVAEVVGQSVGEAAEYASSQHSRRYT